MNNELNKNEKLTSQTIKKILIAEKIEKCYTK